MLATVFGKRRYSGHAAPTSFSMIHTGRHSLNIFPLRLPAKVCTHTAHGSRMSGRIWNGNGIGFTSEQQIELRIHSTVREHTNMFKQSWNVPCGEFSFGREREHAIIVSAGVLSIVSPASMCDLECVDRLADRVENVWVVHPSDRANHRWA